MNHAGSAGAPPEGHLPQSHAFSLAQDLSQVASGPAGPTTMHSLHLVDLTEMTDEVVEDGQQPAQLVHYNELGDVEAYGQAQLIAAQEQQAHDQANGQYLQLQEQPKQESTM